MSETKPLIQSPDDLEMLKRLKAYQPYVYELFVRCQCHLGLSSDKNKYLVEIRWQNSVFWI